VAEALGAVAQGRLMDRLGQPSVLRAAAAGHLLALAGLVLATEEDAPIGILFACAIAGGACLPQLPAAMRALWAALVDEAERRGAASGLAAVGPEPRQTAYAMVAIVFEVAVVTAPVLVAGIVAFASPAAAVLVAVVLGSGSAVAFSLTPASRRWRGHAHHTGWLGPLAAPGMRTVLVALAAMGAAVGVVQVLVPWWGAWSTARGRGRGRSRSASRCC
jgi:hypothetical protein